MIAVAAAAAIATATHESDLQADDREVAAAIAYLKIENTHQQCVAKYMAHSNLFPCVSPEGCQFAGVDFCLFKTIRWQLEGSRFLCLVPEIVVASVLGLSEWSHAELTKAVQALKGDSLDLCSAVQVCCSACSQQKMC